MLDLKKPLLEGSKFRYLLWSQGEWNEIKTPFSDIVELLKSSVERVKEFNPELYNEVIPESYDEVIKGKKPLIGISLRKDEKRLAQCFIQRSGGLEIFFEPNNLRKKLSSLNTKEDKVSFLTYFVAHEMEHARQEQRENVLYVVGKDNEKRPIIEQEIAMETDATAVGIITAKKAGLTLATQEMLESWFRELIPNLKDILDSSKSNEEKEKDLFNEDLKNRTDFWRKEGYKIGEFSTELQNIVQHPDILIEYNKSHLITNVPQKLSSCEKRR